MLGKLNEETRKEKINSHSVYPWTVCTEGSQEDCLHRRITGGLSAQEQRSRHDTEILVVRMV